MWCAFVLRKKYIHTYIHLSGRRQSKRHRYSWNELLGAEKISFAGLLSQLWSFSESLRSWIPRTHFQIQTKIADPVRHCYSRIELLTAYILVCQQWKRINDRGKSDLVRKVVRVRHCQNEVKAPHFLGLGLRATNGKCRVVLRRHVGPGEQRKRTRTVSPPPPPLHG